MLNEWTKHLGCDETLPNLNTLTSFVTPLSLNLPKKSRSAAAQQVTTAAPPKFHGKQYHQQHVHHNVEAAPQQAATTSADSANKTDTQTKKLCPVCKDGQHPLYRCKKFKEATVNQRWQWVRQYKCCHNCLHNSHAVANCTSTYVCKHCKQKHNYLLHKEEEMKKNGISLTVVTKETAESDAVNGSISSKNVTTTLGAGFIHTALVTLSAKNRKITARAALDNCSTHSIVSEYIASYLQPERKPVDIVMKGTVAESKISHWATLDVSTVHPSAVSIPVGVAIAPTLPAATPPEKPQEVAKHKLLQGLSLADPQFGGQLDVIIGTNDLPLFWTSDEKKFCAEARITAINTIFGWSVSGPAASSNKNEEMVSLKVELTEDEDAKLFQTMYQLEKVPTALKLTQEEKSAVEQFNSSVKQGDDGRYSCKLPQVADPPSLGESQKMAKARFFQNERKMAKIGALEPFNDELNSYITMKHAEIVPQNEMESGKFYLPVQGVLKPDSTSTKTRPVFDGSAKSSNGVAVNDLFLVGPNLYPLIADVLLKFRSNKVALTADISKMYREVELHADDREYHRFFVRTSDGKIATARMTRVTFGIRPSPFVATSVIRLHAERNKDKFPQACEEVLHSFYVDDFLSGASTVDEAIQLQQSLCELLAAAGMTLKKWRSSSTEMLKSIPQELVEKEDRKLLVRHDALKTLGIHWDASMDCLFVTTPTLPQHGEVTKRVVARVVAGVYDVLGLVAPFVITGKIILQSLWEKQVGWDDVPDQVLCEWKKWLCDINVVRCHPIHRYTGAVSDVGKVTLHGFADSSCKAFAAAVYVRIQVSDTTVS